MVKRKMILLHQLLKGGDRLRKIRRVMHDPLGVGRTRTQFDNAQDDNETPSMESHHRPPCAANGP